MLQGRLLVGNNEYRCKVIDLEVHYCHHNIWKVFVGLHDAENFGILRFWQSETFVPVSDWWDSYEGLQLLYGPTLPVFGYCSDNYSPTLEDCNRVSVNARTELIIKACMSLFAACQDGQSMHTFGPAVFNTHKSCCLVLLSMAVVEEGEKFGLVKLMRLCRLDPVLSLLALKRMTELDCSHYV